MGENGLLTPERTPTGHRRYRVAELQKRMHEKDESPSFTCAIYARVSTKKQEDAGNLDRQTGRLSAYAAKQGWPIFAVISDTASGLNEHRRGLQKVLQMVARQDVSIVLVEDLIAITTSFSARIYGKRGGKKLVDAIQAALHEEKEGERP